jgi:Tol biopolymer transport system component
MAGQGIGLGPSPTGEHVAFVATTTNGYGTLHLAPTAAGSAQQLSNNVMFLHQVGYAFSSDGSWLTFLRDTGTSSNTAESAWLIPVNGGQGRQLGATVARNHLPRFTPDGQTVFFVDEASTTTGGRLRRHSTMFGTSTTLATGVMAFTLAPQGDQVAFTNNVNLANSTGTLNHYNVNTDDQYGLGSIKAVQFHHDGVRFLDNGTLLFVDNVTADHGTLKTRSTNTAIGTLNTNVWVHDIDTSPNAVRISYTRNGPQAGRYWGALAGGPAVRLGDPVSAFQLFDDDAMVYLNNVMGSPEYGDLTVVRAGGGSAVLATGVPQPGWLPAQAGRYMTYLANHDFGTGSGTLTRLDRTNNATQVLDTNAYDLTIWSPDSDHLAYLTAFDAAQDRGTLKVISAVTPGTPVVLSTSAQRYFTRMSPIPGRVVFLDNYNAATESGDLTLANVDGTGRVVLRTGFHLGNFWVDPLTVKNSDATGRYSVLSDGISSNDIWVLDWQEGVLTHVGTSVRNMTWAAGTHRLCYTVEEGADQGIWVAQFP